MIKMEQEGQSAQRKQGMDSSSKYAMEINNLPNNFRSMNISGKKINDLMQKLESLHCPFTWKPKESETDVRGPQVLLASERKLSGADNEGEECSPWPKFVLNLVMCYENAMRGSIEEALQRQEECEKILEDCPQLPHMPSMGIGLKHVCLACKIHLFFQKDKFEEVSKMLREVIYLNAMEPRDQASIWAVRGAVFLEYGYKGQKESIEFIERAVELDNQCGEMHFLLGKALSRARRNSSTKYEKPSEKELKSFELAVKLTGDKLYMVLLAQSYVDASKYRDASNIYKNVLEDENANPYVLARCGLGLMKLRKPWQDLILAEKIIKQALERIPNSGFLNITAGRLYLKKNQFSDAEMYFSKEIHNENFESVMWFIRAKENKDRSYSPVPDLEIFMKLECFSETKYQNNVLLLIGLYYFLKERNFDKALEYWWEVIEADPLSDVLNHLRNPWQYISNINKIVIREINSRMGRRIPHSKRRMYEKVLQKYRESCPELYLEHLQTK